MENGFSPETLIANSQSPNGHLCKVSIHTKLKYLLTPSLLKRPNKTSFSFNSQCDTLPNWMPQIRQADFSRFNRFRFRFQTDRFNRLLCTDSDFRQILKHSTHIQTLIRCLKDDFTVIITNTCTCNMVSRLQRLRLLALGLWKQPTEFLLVP